MPRKDGRPRSLPIFNVESRPDGLYAQVEVPDDIAAEIRRGTVGGYSVEDDDASS